MKKILNLFIVTIFIYSCSDYQKALKSDDVAVKYDEGLKQYENKNYSSAIRLFEEIAPAYRGKPQAEKMFFIMADSYYKTQQYYLAGYQFESFASAYPKSEKVEEASYLSAECYAKLSPVYSLDQTDTYKAITKLQDFIDQYPNSSYIAQANATLKILTNKLEKKEYENAKLYNTIGDYKSAIVALDNFTSDYPGTIYKEEALYHKLHSCYELAVKSVVSKQEERLNNAKAAYYTLIKYKPNTTYKEKADQILANINIDLQKFSK